MKAVSLFSGCGGFDLGLARNGVDIIWANDIDRAAAKAYKKLFPDTEFIHEDIQNVTKIPNADILIGCYPCTGFSEAAKRKWKDREYRDLTENPKNFLFEEFLRAISIVKPKIIFIENVQGMLSASQGAFLASQIKGLKELGFENPKIELLNAADYGVAQTRKRLFVVAVHKSIEGINYSFPEPTHGKGRIPYRTLRDVIGDLPIDPIGEYSTQRFHGHFLTRNRKRTWDEPSFTIVANADHVALHPAGESMVRLEKDKWILQGEFNRRLSYKECFTIQGIPVIDFDDTLNNKYKVAGNAVPPLLAEAVSKPIIEQMKKL